MSAADLRHQVRALLGEAAAVYAGRPEAEVFEVLAGQLDEPLKVAIAGRVKAGKSTLLNALVGDQVAATDAGECTRVVTWFWNGLTYRAWAVPHEGEPEQLRFTRADGRTTIDLGPWRPDHLARLVVEFPSARLEDLTLIDTPGMASVSTDVSARTVEFLTTDTAAGAGADAVIYLLRHLHASDMSFLESFHDAQFTGTLPVNAIGVLSRADEVGSARTDALDVADRVAARYERDDRVRALVQTVVPVAGLLAQAGSTLRQPEFSALRALAGAPVDDVSALLLSVDRFRESTRATELSVDERRVLLDRFGLFGVRLAVGLLRSGAADSAPSLAAQLLERSGLPRLRSILLSQFTSRRDVLKARAATAAVEHALVVDPRPGSEGLRRSLERITASHHDFEELRLLNDLRVGTVTLPPDTRAAAETLLGATGGSARSRLGLAPGTPSEDLREQLLATLDRWQRVADDPMADRAERRAATVLRRTCEGLFVDPDVVGATPQEKEGAW